MSYQRMNAVMYAAAFWDKVCSDGRVATDIGYPKIPSGTPMDTARKSPNFKGSEDDCTHFISCCIGRTTGKISVGGNQFTLKGGGLDVPSPFKGAGVYGHTHVTNIYYFAQKCGAKIVGQEFRRKSDPATAADISANLTFGDLLVYSSDTHIRHHRHLVMLLSGTRITCHTSARFNKDFLHVGITYVTLLKMP